jgi:hypothetical protein
MLNAEALMIVLAASVAAITMVLLIIVICRVVKMLMQHFAERSSSPAFNLEIVAQIPSTTKPNLSVD